MTQRSSDSAAFNSAPSRFAIVVGSLVEPVQRGMMFMLSPSLPDFVSYLPRIHPDNPLSNVVTPYYYGSYDVFLQNT